MFPKEPAGWFALAAFVFILAVIAIIVINR
jgi:hypothetical protein